MDVFRNLNPEDPGYTCFKEKIENYFMRVDYILADKNLSKHFIKCKVLNNIEGSDHFPLKATLNF